MSDTTHVAATTLLRPADQAANRGWLQANRYLLLRRATQLGLLALFLLVRQFNRFRKKEEAAPAAPPAEETLLREIRDLLKQRQP